MKDLWKKISIRVLLLGMIVILSNYLYRYTTYEKDIAENSPLWLEFQNAVAEADVIYFSSSPNAAYSDIYDDDYRSISKIVDDDLNDLKVISVDTGAIHADIFKTLIRRIPESSPVNSVVVHLNYRSFGAGWMYSNLESSIQKQAVFYHDRPAIINRFLLGLNHYDVLSEKEGKRKMDHLWETEELPFEFPRNTVENWCKLDKWGGYGTPERTLADSYIKNFAFVLDEENPRIQDFDEIVELCNEKNLDLIFVLLPENLEQAEELVGKELIQLMTTNKNWLVDRYEGSGVTVIDNFSLLPDSSFLERDFPSEHYYDEGRQAIAQSIVKYFKQRN